MSLPLFRVIRWWALPIHFAILGIFVVIFNLLGIDKSAIWASLLFISYSFLARMLISRSHRRGIARLRQGNFELALKDFTDSEKFFREHTWIDRQRAWVMLSASAMSFIEMAMTNQGYCLFMMDKKAEALALYQKILLEFSNNPMAINAMKGLNQVESDNHQSNV